MLILTDRSLNNMKNGIEGILLLIVLPAILSASKL